MTKQIYRTETRFGRHARILGELNGLLQTREQAYSGLVVGAGVSYDVLMYNTGIPIMNFNPDDVFSWEHIELLGLLRNFNILSDVSVIDPSEKVCMKIREQGAVPMHDFYGFEKDYTLQILSVLPHELADSEAVEEINRKLKEERIGNRISLMARVGATPLSALLNQDFLAESSDLGQYDIITMLESARYMCSLYRLEGRIKELLKEGGLLVFGDGSGDIRPESFKYSGLTEIIMRHFEDNKDYWCEAIFQKQS